MFNLIYYGNLLFYIIQEQVEDVKFLTKINHCREYFCISVYNDSMLLEVLKLKYDWIKYNNTMSRVPSRLQNATVTLEKKAYKRAIPSVLARAMPRRFLANNKMLL